MQIDQNQNTIMVLHVKSVRGEIPEHTKNRRLVYKCGVGKTSGSSRSRPAHSRLFNLPLWAGVGRNPSNGMNAFGKRKVSLGHLTHEVPRQIAREPILEILMEGWGRNRSGHGTSALRKKNIQALQIVTRLIIENRAGLCCNARPLKMPKHRKWEQKMMLEIQKI